ncbi:ABC transporter permease protein YxdM [Mortierella sp. GBA39]|nr:ABC transporter permease protein YxdM [Mortierella sp. GBA39]
MPQSKYNQLAEAVGAPKVGKLDYHQAVHVIPASEVSRERPDWYDLRKITLRDTKAELDITDTIKPAVNVSPTLSDMLIISDDEYQANKKLLSSEPKSNRIQGSVVYIIPDWSTGTVPAEGDPEISIGMKLKQEGIDRVMEDKTHNIINSRGGDYYSLRQSFAMMSFAGIFITAVLSISSASFLYFKLHHELTQDQRMYQSMSKIGLKIQEMSRAATLQIAALFFVPIVVSVIQTLVVLNAVRKDFGVGEVNSSVLIASIAFVIVQMVYFLIVRSRYVHKLKRVMV